jgi:hypothetical protein
VDKEVVGASAILSSDPAAHRLYGDNNVSKRHEAVGSAIGGNLYGVSSCRVRAEKPLCNH